MRRPPVSKRTHCQFALLGLFLLDSVCNNSSKVSVGVLALSFGGGAGGRSPGAGHPSPGNNSNNNNSPIQILRVTLDDDKEDPQQAVCSFNSEMRGGGGGGGGGEETVLVTPRMTSPSSATAAEASPVNPTTLKAAVGTLQCVLFWNDALQEFSHRLTLRHLLKAVGLRRRNNELEEQEAPNGAERFADDDEMVQLVGVRKWWPMPDGGTMEGAIGVNIVRASTLFERHETSASLQARPGPAEREWKGGNGTAGWGWWIPAPTFNLGALMSSPDEGGRQSRFSPFAVFVMSAAESLHFAKQQVLLRFVQKGVLSAGQLPRHVSNLNGCMARVRDYNEMNVFDTSGSPYWEYTSIAPVSSYFKGTVELEIQTKSILQGSFFKVFGDLSFAHGIRRRAGEEEKMVSPFDNIIRKSCIGAGFYKVPFRFGVSYSEDGRAGISFGLTHGSDF